MAILTSLLCGLAFGVGVQDALTEARDALQRAARARSANRLALLKQARNALASLPSEARAPLERLISDAEAKGDLASIETARRSVEAYLQAMDSTPSPAPDVVKKQLDAIFAEPDMYVPPKSWMERFSEAVLRAFELFIDWLRRLFGGLGIPRVGGLEPFLQWLVIALLVLTIGLAASYVVGRVRIGRRAKPPALSSQALFTDARTLSALEWREMARRLANEQNWPLAVRACYLGILRLLHETHLLDYDPALTNWEHLQRLRQPLPVRLAPTPPSPDPAVREEAYQLLRPLTLQFDAIWYGGVSPNESVYRAFENAFETLHGRLQSHAVPA
ncbi:MAG: DUF4129 domain-containing protein [Fimbriimonadales bacterium]|nr:DUF4129 domain-containing protein [Fimbriimonadales bacterium]